MSGQLPAWPQIERRRAARVARQQLFLLFEHGGEAALQLGIDRRLLAQRTADDEGGHRLLTRQRPAPVTDFLVGKHRNSSSHHGGEIPQSCEREHGCRWTIATAKLSAIDART